MVERSFAHTLLESAPQYVRAMTVLAEVPDLHDAIIGFHAQQAVEKCLKAVLSHGSVVFRRTHDIAELLDLLADAGLPAPPHADSLDDLNPYAVEARYSAGLIGGLDRHHALTRAEAVVRWATAVVAG